MLNNYDSSIEFIQLSDNSYVGEFFTKVADEIHKNQEDGSLQQVFAPVLDTVLAKFTVDYDLMHPEVSRYIELVMFFTQSVPLAEVRVV